MKQTFKILSPCGILGYGFPEESFLSGMADKPDAVVVDAGSTDAGPHKLGAGVAIVSRYACKRDLQLMVVHGLQAGIPIIVGSAGGSGARTHVEWTLSILHEILQEQQLSAKVAVIWADIPHEAVAKAAAAGTLQGLSPNVPAVTAQSLQQTNTVVAQMGAEPIIEALQQGAQIILCGRAYDPSPFAAVGIHAGFDPAYCYHLGKILECGALCAEPSTAKDCIMGVLDKDGFEVYATNPERTCRPISVAAHTFYEKDHPYLLHGPGIVLNLAECKFQEVKPGRTRVTGSRLTATDPYCIKLEGARCVGYRTFVIAGVRDPIFIARLEECEREVEQAARAFFKTAGSFTVNFYNYGLNGVMGSAEPHYGDPTRTPYEVCVLFEVVSTTSQQEANDICGYLRSTLLHFGFVGRKATAGNLAFPFAPSDVPFGAVYEFSLYHLMPTPEPTTYFPITWQEVRNGKAI